MNTVSAYANLKEAGQPVMRSNEVATRLHLQDSTTTALLRRLERAGLVSQVHHGLWAIKHINPLDLPEHLTAPSPSYISFESALYQHDMIEQIPPRVTVASVAKSRVVRTAIGTFVIRHIPPRLFGGFDDRAGIRLATAEKALFDTVYRASQRGWNATYFPEVAIPDGFDSSALDHWIDMIVSPKLRTMVTAVLHDLGVPVVHTTPSSVIPDRARERAREAGRTELVRLRR